MPSGREQTCYTWLGKALRLEARVIPRSSRARIGAVANGRLQVHVHAPPSQGQANRELIRLLSEAFGVPKSAVTIASGIRARNKTVRIKTPRTLPPNLQ